MTARMLEATAAAVAMTQRGITLRAAAIATGVALSTIVRARRRAGMPPLKRGRPVASNRKEKSLDNERQTQ